MKNKKLIIYGIGNFAEYVHYVFEKDSHYHIIGHCIETSFLKANPELKSQNIIDFDTIEREFDPYNTELFIAVGNNVVRKRLFDEAKKKNFRLANYLSSKATYWENLKLGENNFIDEGTTIQPFVEFGNNNIVFVSNIGHHTIFGNHILLSVSTTGGNSRIKDNTFIGMNSVIKQNVVVERNNIIGMGCIIDHNTQPNSVYTHKGTTKRDSSYHQVAERFLK